MSSETQITRSDWSLHTFHRRAMSTETHVQSVVLRMLIVTGSNWSFRMSISSKLTSWSSCKQVKSSNIWMQSLRTKPDISDTTKHSNISEQIWQLRGDYRHLMIAYHCHPKLHIIFGSAHRADASKSMSIDASKSTHVIRIYIHVINAQGWVMNSHSEWWMNVTLRNTANTFRGY